MSTKQISDNPQGQQVTSDDLKKPKEEKPLSQAEILLGKPYQKKWEK
jgi:hypothetical protein